MVILHIQNQNAIRLTKKSMQSLQLREAKSPLDNLTVVKVAKIPSLHVQPTPEFYHHVQNSTPLDPILCHVNPFLLVKSCFF